MNDNKLCVLRSIQKSTAFNTAFVLSKAYKRRGGSAWFAPTQKRMVNYLLRHGNITLRDRTARRLYVMLFRHIFGAKFVLLGNEIR